MSTLEDARLERLKDKHLAKEAADKAEKLEKVESKVKENKLKGKK